MSRQKKVPMDIEIEVDPSTQEERDRALLDRIRRITEKGADAMVKKKGKGTDNLEVYEVKMSLK